MPTVRLAHTSQSRLATSLAAMTLIGASIGSPSTAAAQSPEPTRVATIEAVQLEKLPMLRPYVPTPSERFIDAAQVILEGPHVGWHPFFESAYRGGGLALGAGYRRFVSAYNVIDVRGSDTVSGYKRIEAEFSAPRLFDRRARLSVLGGWREATQVNFFGTGTATSVDNRTNYAFRRPYASALLTVTPTRNHLMFQGGAEWTEWREQPGEGGGYASVETKFTPATLPGLGASPSYLHSQGTVGFDWRTSSGYSRRGGYYGVTFHDFTDRDHAFGFEQLDYEAIQNVPLARETWALSLHAKASTTFNKDGQQVPFFMLPALGGGTDLRGFDSWRFRDRHSLLLQAEWRIMANRFLDTAVFSDAGTVASRVSDLNLNQLKVDYGFGLRFHAPYLTLLRFDIARSNEKTALVVGSSASF